jgi:hypothetical protein
MPAFITITDAQTDPEAPLTSELAKQWRDNPEAIAEGALNAPKILGPAMGIGRPIVSGASAASPIGWTDLDRVLEMDIFWCGGTTNNGTSRWQASLSDDAGATWAAWTDLIAINVGAAVGTFTHRVRINIQTGAFLFAETTVIGAGTTTFLRTGTGTITLPAGAVNGLRFRQSAGSGGSGNIAGIIVKGVSP